MKSGIVEIRNLKNDRCYLFYADDMQDEIVKQRFNLDLGIHPCEELQRDYTQTGLEVFRFDAVEETSDPSRLEELLKERSAVYN
ncbi:MAG: hypothetical protein K5634_01040 [Sphaerochaetaceae bacterium]|nr:hypothetical protein [Sphaerochaetaceae bacterium]